MSAPGRTHGTRSCYQGGCGCVPCREANRRYRQYGTRNPDAPRTTFIVAGDWTELAWCRADPEGWVMPDHVQRFPSRTRPHPKIEAARDGCSVCPVMPECRRWIMAHADDPTPWHVTAGLTPRERNDIRWKKAA